MCLPCSFSQHYIPTPLHTPLFLQLHTVHLELEQDELLDRMLARRHQLHRVKRNHPHSVELTDALPKAI